MKQIMDAALPAELSSDKSIVQWLEDHTTEITSSDPAQPNAKTFKLDFGVLNVVGDVVTSSIYIVTVKGLIKYLTFTLNEAPIVTIIATGSDHQKVWKKVTQKLLTVLLSAIIKDDNGDTTNYHVAALDAPVILHTVKNLSKGIKEFKTAMASQGIEINSKHLATKLY